MELNNKQLYDQNNDKLAGQEEYFGEILDRALDIKHNSNLINQELRLQDGLIDTLTGKATSNLEALRKGGRKLDEIIERQSFCK